MKLLNTNNFDYIVTILLGTMEKNPKTIPVICKNLDQISQKFETTKDKIFKTLKKILLNNIKKKYEWEEIWVLNLMLKININESVGFIDNILDKLNDLSLIMIINEIDSNHILKNKIKKIKNRSWLFYYELFRNDLIDIDLLKEIDLDDKLISNFEVMKSENITLYNKIDNNPF